MCFKTNVYEDSYKSSARTKTEELLESADMKLMSKVVKKRRWKMVGHMLGEDQTSDCNTAMTWAPE